MPERKGAKVVNLKRFKSAREARPQSEAEAQGYRLAVSLARVCEELGGPALAGKFWESYAEVKTKGCRK